MWSWSKNKWHNLTVPYNIYNKKYELRWIDYVFADCKNIQKINTIEIHFYVTTDDYFAITYNFHSIDFEMWKEIVEIHREHIEESFLLAEFDEEVVDINELKNNDTYYSFTLKSKEFNLYRNINIIFFLKGKNWDTMDESIRRNTWK